MMASLNEIGLINADSRENNVSEKDRFFDALVNGLDVERKKPFPDLFLEAARRIETAPEHCWVVEDSVGGIRAAKAAGMRCLALLTTFSEEEIRKTGPDMIVRDLSFTTPKKLI